MENYPALKSNQNVMHLQEELTSTENRISFARQLYNDLVANYLTRIQIFPNNLISSLLGFRREEYFYSGRGRPCRARREPEPEGKVIDCGMRIAE